MNVALGNIQLFLQVDFTTIKKTKQMLYLRRFARSGIICTIEKREKHPWRSVTFCKAAG